MPLGPLALVLSSAATASIAFAIARSIGAARSKKARAQLGEPLDRVPETGGAVTLRGRLAAGPPLCRRFEDGRDAAATTVASLTAPAEASARAEALVLYVGDTAVRLEGPVCVLAGSREKTAGSNVAPPRGGVVDRVRAVDPEIAWVLWNRPSKLRLRALSHGDRVRVSGVLQRSDAPLEGSAKGYRDAGAPWCLVPDANDARDPPALRVACEGAPGGPPVRRATLAGAIAGALLVAIAAVMAPPTLPAETGSADPPSSAASGPWRDRSFDRAERALEEGDFEAAASTYPARTSFATQAAELHLIAGHGPRAAEIANRRADANPLVYESAVCLAEALRSRELVKGAALDPLDLRDEVNRSEGHKRAYCGLLLADFLEGDERVALVHTLPSTGDGNLARLRALLLLEAGRVPDTIPRDEGRLPFAGVLLERAPYHFHDAVLSVHITRAIQKHPLADKIDPRFRALEAARAAQVLSALGDAAGAREASKLVNVLGTDLDLRELTGLRVAIELRAGALADAARIGSQRAFDYDMLQVMDVLTGSETGPERLRQGSLALRLWERARVASDGNALAAELMRPGTLDDGELLFLLAGRVTHGRDALLAWVRTGNRLRDRHDGKGPRAPYPPEDFLARLEERRIMAAALGDPALAADLEAKLRRAREQLLRRDIAAVRFVLHHSSLHD